MALPMAKIILALIKVDNEPNKDIKRSNVQKTSITFIKTEFKEMFLRLMRASKRSLPRI